MSGSENIPRPWWGVFGLLTLYAGKASGILVTLLFIPLYNRTLGPEQFGVAAVLLSLQALLIMLDFGLSTLVSRDVAAAQAPSVKLWTQIRNAERALLGFYIVILLVLVAAQPFQLFGQISTLTLICSVALFGFLVLQNLHYCVIIAGRHYVRASMIQSLGNLARAAATAFMLHFYSPTLEVFVVVQTVCAALQAWTAREQSNGLYGYSSANRPALGESPSWSGTMQLIRRSAPLAIFAGAGAAVMQLDKPIISGFMTSTDVGPYFLAMTLCMVPTSVLAGPVTQYFHPRVLANTTSLGERDLRKIIDRFTLTLVTVTLLPCVMIWLLRDPLIALWLGHGGENHLVAGYVEILLPGVMIGALGYIPYTLLLAVQDYRFQAGASTSLSILTLCAATWAAYIQSVLGVVIIYALYHTSSTALSWGRAIYLEETRKPALRSCCVALFFLLMAGLAMLIAPRAANSFNLI